MHLKQCLLLLLIVKLSVCVNSELINRKVLRKINLDGQFVKIDAIVTVQNLGLNNSNEYIYTIDPNVEEYYIKFRNKFNEELRNEKINNEFKVFFGRNVSQNQTFDLKIEIIYIGQVIPLHKKIKFSEDQFVLYNGNLHYYSYYKTLLSKTTYSWNEVEDLELSDVPQDRQGNTLTYIHENLQPLSVKDVKMEFKNNNPFFVVTNLERIIDVSHFGQICIQDGISIKNAGNKLVGPYMNNQSKFVERASHWWFTHLPASVQYVEYFDTIGNNSNSILLHLKNYKTLKFKPRYPVLSGWKTFYIVKYCVPAFEYLYHDLNGRFVLKIRAVDHILNDVVIKKAIVKVLLPESAQVVKTDIPFGFEQLENEKTYTGLTTFGRPTIVINGSNILENHIAYLQVEYLFSITYLFRAPLVLVVYLKSIFVFIILVAHIKAEI